MWRQYLQFTCTKELFLEAVPHSLSSKVCPANIQQIYRRGSIRKCDFKKSCVALLHGCSNVNLLGIWRTPFWKNTSGGLVLCFISFVFVQVINNTFYWLAFYNLQTKICRPFLRFSLFYEIFFEIIFQMLAVTKAPIISLVKQMFVVIAEAVPYRCSWKTIIWSILVINVKRNI